MNQRSFLCLVWDYFNNLISPKELNQLYSWGTSQIPPYVGGCTSTMHQWYNLSLELLSFFLMMIHNHRPPLPPYITNGPCGNHIFLSLNLAFMYFFILTNHNSYTFSWGKFHGLGRDIKSEILYSIHHIIGQ